MLLENNIEQDSVKKAKTEPLCRMRLHRPQKPLERLPGTSTGSSYPTGCACCSPCRRPSPGSGPAPTARSRQLSTSTLICRCSSNGKWCWGRPPAHRSRPVRLHPGEDLILDGPGVQGSSDIKRLIRLSGSSRAWC